MGKYSCCVNNGANKTRKENKMKNTNNTSNSNKTLKLFREIYPDLIK